jgi:hypothetical protein
VRNECGGKPALVTMQDFISPGSHSGNRESPFSSQEEATNPYNPLDNAPQDALVEVAGGCALSHLGGLIVALLEAIELLQIVGAILHLEIAVE